MSPRDRITESLRAARHPALVAFLTAGYPSRERFVDSLQRIANAADAVEIGVPFSDPMADGVTIQRSSEAAIESGVTLQCIFDELAAGKGSFDAPLLLMSYLNPLLAYGYDRLAEAAAQADVCGFMVPDLPWEECAPQRDALGRHDIDDRSPRRAVCNQPARRLAYGGHPGFRRSCVHHCRGRHAGSTPLEEEQQQRDINEPDQDRQ